MVWDVQGRYHAPHRSTGLVAHRKRKPAGNSVRPVISEDAAVAASPLMIMNDCSHEEGRYREGKQSDIPGAELVNEYI